MSNDKTIGNIAEEVMGRYQDQLNLMVKQHETMLTQSRANLEQLIAESNAQMTELVSKVGLGQSQPPDHGGPEVAWVAAQPDGKKDHLVLNPQAIALIDKLFTAINEVLPELAKLVKRR